jgi:hypothetical protein
MIQTIENRMDMRIIGVASFFASAIVILIAGACSDSPKSLFGIASGTVLSTVKRGTGWGLVVQQSGKVKLLPHNTKSMVAIPGRLHDLRVPGWQQEHWSLAPLLGNGLHRGWLPWVSTSQLNGIPGLKELDENLYNELCK